MPWENWLWGLLSSVNSWFGLQAHIQFGPETVAVRAVDKDL